MPATKPTAATHFASNSTANKAKIQAVLDSITAGASRDAVLSAVNGIGFQMNAVDRENLVNMAYSQLAQR